MKREFENKTIDGLIEGRNAVHEALRAHRVINKVFYVKSDGDKMLSHLAHLAKEAGAVVVPCDRRKLDSMSETGSHQGIIALAATHEYAEVSDIIENAEKSGRPALIVVCDEISDPHNLGAIIRSAEAAGAHGVIIPKRRSAALTAVVEKASAGAVSYLPVARVPNIAACLENLKKQGMWVFGTALRDNSVSLYDADLKGNTVIVIGSEGEGMSRLTAEKCDFTVKIPMIGKIESLNASCAAAVVLYEAVRQRGEE